jgi:hypothetical protein
MPGFLHAVLSHRAFYLLSRHRVFCMPGFLHAGFSRRHVFYTSAGYSTEDRRKKSTVIHRGCHVWVSSLPRCHKTIPLEDKVKGVVSSPRSRLFSALEDGRKTPMRITADTTSVPTHYRDAITLPLDDRGKEVDYYFQKLTIRIKRWGKEVDYDSSRSIRLCQPTTPVP